MAKLVSVSITGKKALIDRINQYQQNLQSELKAEMSEAAEEVLTGAANYLSNNDEGTLRRSLRKEEVTLPPSQYKWEVGTDLYYAPYIEFGTGRKANDLGYPAYANTFKGRKAKGDFKQFVKNLTGWVKRKGIASEEKEAERIAGLIADDIIRNGQEARPFLFPAFLDVANRMPERLKNLLKRL